MGQCNYEFSKHLLNHKELELLSKWKTNDALNFDFNYTYTISTYDGAEQDDPNKNSDYYNSQMVRVPRHFFNLATNYVFPDKNLSLTLHTKISDKVRDYGNANQPAGRIYEDVKLNSYMVNDLSLNYKLWGTYNVFFDVINILDKKYTTALQYSQMDRSFNFGIKRSILKMNKFKENINSFILQVVVIILKLCLLTRLIPHPWNFSPMLAVGVFSGILF